jgi:AmpE protein
MSATLIAVIFALVLGHVAPALATAVRQYDWYRVWLGWLDARFPEGENLWRGRYGVLLAVLPPLLPVILFQIALYTPLAGVVGLLFGIVALFYVWGPRDLDQDVSVLIDAEDPEARRTSARHLGLNGDVSVTDGGAMVEAVFGSALRRWFGVLFWFLLLGASGAVLYRLVQLAADETGSDPDAGKHGIAERLPAATRDGARGLLALLDWPVAQLMTLSLALVGNFDTVIGAWKEAEGARFRRGHAFLAAAARASVRCEIAEEAQELIEEGNAPSNAWAQLGELPELRDAMSLVWRILLLWMAILALFVVAGWVS